MTLLIVILIIPSLFSTSYVSSQLFDFTTIGDVDDWVELSDIVKSTGMSKAQLVLQKTKTFQRGIMFSLLNPQENGAGFAGTAKLGITKNFEDYQGLELKCRAQGLNGDYRMILKHKGMNEEPHISYEQTFHGPRRNFEIVKVPFNGFIPYYRGKLSNTTVKLDTSNLTGFGIQFYSDICSSIQQAGPAALEIDWIQSKLFFSIIKPFLKASTINFS
ncbi:uncharacterized protein LOC143909156 [Arctopsyche grandis]|uniref:uncharacterized protein LOC143909156 n=1 Tax=Arctopsyche grandis TaxID=121162 RepID=UPI00406D666C